MMTQETPLALPVLSQQSLLDRVRATALRLLGLMLPGLSIADRCPCCRVGLTLVSDQLIEWDEVAQLHGIGSGNALSATTALANSMPTL
jgi:hypothetical protein